MLRLSFLFTVCIPLIISGCASDYRLAAIKDARLYALETHPDFSEKSIHQIKFTTPEIQQKIIFEQEDTGSKLDFTQTCFAWDLKDLDGKSLIIVGFGERQLKDWYPVRSIVRRYRKVDDEQSKSDKSKKKVIRDSVKKKRTNRKKRASK